MTMIPQEFRQGSPFEGLIRLVARLRGEKGCPWDKKQTAQSMSRYLQEEVDELAEAIASMDPEHIREELGDVLFHIVFLSRLFEEKGEFTIHDVEEGIVEKMVRRHPHVFGDKKIHTPEEVITQWNEIKKKEKATSG